MKSYLDEILEQPYILNNISLNFNNEIFLKLNELIKDINNNNCDKIILTGMGGSFYCSYFLYLFLIKHIKIPICLLDCSELIHNAENIITKNSILIATSQSGESIELVKLTKFKKQPKISISITNLPNNTLANWSNIPLYTFAGLENTVSTKTYTGGYAIQYLLGCALLKEEEKAFENIKLASTKIKNFLDNCESNIDSAAEFLAQTDSLTFLGRGYSYSSAAFSALITSEASKIPCLSLTSSQFRHGPIEIAREGFKCVIFCDSKETEHLDIELINDIKNFGGKCFIITSAKNNFIENTNVKILKLPFINEELQPMMEVIPIQLLQIPFAKEKGFEPAKFINASKITTKE